LTCRTSKFSAYNNHHMRGNVLRTVVGSLVIVLFHIFFCLSVAIQHIWQRYRQAFGDMFLRHNYPWYEFPTQLQFTLFGYRCRRVATCFRRSGQNRTNWTDAESRRYRSSRKPQDCRRMRCKQRRRFVPMTPLSPSRLAVDSFVLADRRTQNLHKQSQLLRERQKTTCTSGKSGSCRRTSCHGKV